ncbi:condensation domain-containing protein [Williamsia soli]|uniref:condensation domain-containing protein n=1 Tax=Williamsia soli TaxID=364929 RepID=UPI001A9CF246|nr:condensation domain-containing protein [Williamsia soli]
MVNFGLINEWEPTPGRLTSWVASLASVAEAGRAPKHPTPPSHQQEEYLRTAGRNESVGFRFSRLCLVAFDFDTPLDTDAMTRTVNTFLRRHDTFSSWFAAEPDGSIVRHVMDPAAIDFVPTDHGVKDSANAIRQHVQDETPGPFSWDCFTFGAIEHGSGFTLYAAFDHLVTDGISSALALVELLQLYSTETQGIPSGLSEVGSYVEYCARERSGSAELTLESPHVERWVELVRNNGGTLPTFPLDLGVSSSGYARTAHLSATLFSEADAERFATVCRENGAAFTPGVLAVAALASHEFTGNSRYFGLTPKSTRATPAEFSSIGWFTSLIPVPLTIEESSTFTSIVGAAQQSYDAGKELTDVSFHRVMQLVEPDSGIDVQPGWSVPMVSYIDVRKLPGVDVFDALNAGLFGNRGSSEEVFLWINRFNDKTSISLLFPDTDEAHIAIKLYVDRLTEIFTTIAGTGDYSPSVAALAS